MTISFVSPYRFPPPAAGGYLAETEAWIAACTTAPSEARKEAVDTFIGALKTAGVWSKTNLLYLLAAHAVDDALINVRSPGSFDLTKVNSPWFDTDQGFTGNGSDMYLDTGWDAATDGGGVLAQNDAHLGVYVRSGFTNPLAAFGTGTGGITMIRARRSGQNDGAVRVNGSSNLLSSTLGAVDYPYHVMGIRRNSSQQRLFLDGAQDNSGSSTSISPDTDDFNVLRTNSNYGSFQVAAAHCGAALDDTEAAAYYAALHTYMVTVGADT